MAERSCSNSSCSKESCEGCPSAAKPQSFQVEPNAYTQVKHVIGVVSGKGGVGKSMVTASLANLLAEKGYRVGILDADITGPSIPKMYGLTGPAQASEEGILPELAGNDVKVMSLNLLMPDPEQAVIAAHTLKGVCGNLCMVSLYGLFAQQVDALRAGDLSLARHLMDQITPAYVQVAAAIREHPDGGT